MTFTLKDTWFLLLRYVPSPFVREEENVDLRCAIAVFVFDLFLVFLSLSLSFTFCLSRVDARESGECKIHSKMIDVLFLFWKFGQAFYVPNGYQLVKNDVYPNGYMVPTTEVCPSQLSFSV